MKELGELDGLDSMNSLVKEHNALFKDWSDLVEPLDEAKEKMKKAGGLEKDKGAQLCHILLGFTSAVWVSLP